jgi:6-pyruvoyl-tetrahydropterin synthase
MAVPVDALDKLDAQHALQQAVNEVLLDELDHKFLNTDCDWFNQQEGGVIPSVENITRVCFEQLAPAIESAGHGLRLVRIQAWETEKTSAIYPA